jgi:ATP-dependent exoDNAse (exonuclease V) beta subunit
MTKQKTNDKAMKALLKALDNNPNGALYYALLRERILHIMDATLADMENNPDAWKKTYFNPDVYKSLNEIVQKHLSFNE